MATNSRGIHLTEVPDKQLAVLRVLDRAVNFYVADSLKELIRAQVQQSTAKGLSGIVLDLTEVEVMDSCGVELLIRVREQVVEHGGQLALAGLLPVFQRMLEMMRLTPYFEMASDIEGAIEKLAATTATSPSH